MKNSAEEIESMKGINFMSSQEVEPKKRLFRRSAQSGFLPKLENVPKIPIGIFTASIRTQL